MQNQSGSIGEIFGSTNPFRITLKLNEVVKRSDYVETYHEENYHIFKVNRLWEDKKGAFAELICIGEPPQTPFSFSCIFKFAEQSRIEKALGIKNDPWKSLSIGKLYKTNIDVFLPIKNFGRIFITGKSGSGKSYTVGVLIEEMLRRRIPVVIIDRHGEYASLKVKDPLNSPPKFNEFERCNISFNISKNNADEIPQTSILQENQQTNHDVEEEFILPDIPNDENEQNKNEILSNEREKSSLPSNDSMKNKNENESEKINVDGWDENFGFSKMIIEFADLKINMNADLGIDILLKADPSILIDFGQCSIVNLAGSEIEYQESVISKLLNKLYYASVRRQIPPFFLFIDEAHVFAGKKETECVKMIKLFAQEGRKFGANIVIITQKPQLLDTTIRSQAGTWIIHKLTDVNDIKLAISSSEGLSTENTDDISGLAPGQAIITGDAAPLAPIFINVRKRYTIHGGAGYNVMEAVENAENFANTELKKRLLQKLAESQKEEQEILQEESDSEMKPANNVNDEEYKRLNEKIEELTNLNSNLTEKISLLEKECAVLKADLEKKQEQVQEAWKKVNEKNKEIVDLKNSRTTDAIVQKFKQEIKELTEKLEKEKKRADEAVDLAEKLIAKIKAKK
jgi:hypothetical protein